MEPRSPDYALLEIEGMHCAGCAASVERGLRRVPGVADARVSLVTARASVEYDPARAAPEALLAAVAQSGYQARLAGDEDDARAVLAGREARESAAWRRRLAVGAILLAPLLWVTYLSPLYGAALAWAQFALATPIQLYVGWPYLAGAARRLRYGSANMDTLIALGTSVAYLAGTAHLAQLAWGSPSGHAGHAGLTHEAMYFADAGMILTFITLGKFLEAKAKGRASQAIRRLLDLSPAEATVLRNGEEKGTGSVAGNAKGSEPAESAATVPVPFSSHPIRDGEMGTGTEPAPCRSAQVSKGSEPVPISPSRLRRLPLRAVLVGDTILVRPGEKTPLDAEVLSGNSSVDESWLTGESMPVEKHPGATILAGTINGQGSLVARVLRPAGKTALAQVIELVRRAQESKTEAGRLADRVVAWFVPAVLGIAAAAFLAWGPLAGQWTMALSAAVAVLVVACPCALGLATPTAILVGSGRGAEMGILVKDAHALEVAGRLTTVVLDKTGTVTLGKPCVTGLHPAEGVTEEDLLGAAAAAERLSAHPLSRAVVAEADARGLPPGQADEAAEVPGQGVRAAHEGRTLLVGSERLLESAGVDAAPFASALGTLRSQGRTPLLVARGGRVLGLIAVADAVASHSREAVARLAALGLDVRLLTGDHRAAAEAVAAEVGIREVLAGVLPGQKQDVVRELQASGRTVAMVGDGINDAPALAAADLGIAIGAGADVAIEAAQVVLVHRDLRGVARFVELARATLRTIRQNLAWAFGYNAALLPLAAGALVPLGGPHLPPAAAAAAMAASSVSVVANSLRLRRWRPAG